MHREERLEYGRKYYRANKEKCAAYHKEYHPKHRERRNELARLRRKDPIFRLNGNISGRIADCLNGDRSNSTEGYIGCSIEELASHLESLFEPGMSWGNFGRGGWSVDHVVPIARLIRDGCSPETIHHWTNLQPMWEEDNNTKRDKLPREWDEHVAKHGRPSDRKRYGK
jgi:5-methylcytosine-specific restriction endonuclease McrA